MSKRKKGFLTAGAIITIVAAVFSLLGSLLMFAGASYLDDDFIVKMYKEDEDFTYYETFDGDFYFEYVEDGKIEKITEDDIELVADIIETGLSTIGFVMLAFGGAKLALSILLLINNNKNKNSRGRTISLLVLSMITMSIVESILFILAMCSKDDKIQVEENKPLGLNDINIENENKQ